MALKGLTRIELTDVHTGATEVVEKHNLVTNAIPDLLQLNPDGFLFDGNYELSSNLLPLCPNAIGGILLYGDTLEEDPTKYYAPDTNPLIGYASNNVNGTTDTKRGSMNQTESGPLDDGSGYRFVFDFETSQGNGTISALGLTSKHGGVAGYGSALDVSNPVLQISAKAKTVTDANRKALWANAHIVSMDFESGIAYFAYVSAAKTITVGKIRINALGLNGTTGAEPANVIEEKTITSNAFAPSIKDYYSYTALVDGGDGYIWGFGHANNAQGNSSGLSSILWIKISKADWSSTEGTWSIDKRFNHFGMTCVRPGDNSLKCNTNCIVYKGYLYCVDYWKSSIIKLSLTNPSDLEYIHDPDASIPIVSGTSACEFNVVGDILYFPGGIFVDGVVYGSAAPNASSTTGLYSNMKPNLQYGPYLLGYKATGSSITRTIYLMTPYLATINNLDTPVQKTADKTMKITYILREE